MSNCAQNTDAILVNNAKTTFAYRRIIDILPNRIYDTYIFFKQMWNAFHTSGQVRILKPGNRKRNHQNEEEGMKKKIVNTLLSIT
jgi:hypothetical protein